MARPKHGNQLTARRFCDNVACVLACSRWLWVISSRVIAVRVPMFVGHPILRLGTVVEVPSSFLPEQP